MWKWLIKIIVGSDNTMTFNEEIETRRSRVRVCVTYWAALYIFGGSALLIALSLSGQLETGQFEIIREIFTMVLPIATGVVTYWFAARKQGEKQPPSPIND